MITEYSKQTSKYNSLLAKMSLLMVTFCRRDSDISVLLAIPKLAVIGRFGGFCTDAEDATAMVVESPVASYIPQRLTFGTSLQNCRVSSQER
jgi:hypothetical protein